MRLSLVAGGVRWLRARARSLTACLSRGGVFAPSSLLHNLAQVSKLRQAHYSVARNEIISVTTMCSILFAVWRADGHRFRGRCMRARRNGIRSLVGSFGSDTSTLGSG